MKNSPETELRAPPPTVFCCGRRSVQNPTFSKPKNSETVSNDQQKCVAGFKQDQVFLPAH